MKKFLFILLPAFTLVSCFKSQNRDFGSDYSGDGDLKYQLNNSSYEYTGGASSVTSRGIGVFARKQLKSGTVPATRYIIMGQLSLNKKINLVIVTDSLKTGTYSASSVLNAPTYVKIDSIQYSAYKPEDVININVTGYSNGKIQGTFSGKLSSSTNDNGSIKYSDGLITNGSFENIAVQFP